MIDEIHIKQWIKSGGMLYNTYGLEINHPEHPYNQALAQGVVPEDFGIEHPYEQEYKDKSRGQLIHELIDTRKQLEACMRYC